MTTLTLTDAQIRDAFDRRAAVPVPSDIRGAVLAAVAAEPQRWSWAARAAEALNRAPRRRVVLVLATVALLIAMATAIALVGSRDQPLPGAGPGLAFISGGDLWVADLDGTHPRRVWGLPGTIASRPTWVDANTVLVQEGSAGVYVVDLRSSTARVLLDGHSGGSIAVPPQATDGFDPYATPSPLVPAALLAISPDHRSAAIGFQSDNPQIYIMVISVGMPSTMMDVTPAVVPPADSQVGVIGTTGGPRAWSPDGHWLLGAGFDTNVSGTSGWIYQLDVQTGETRDLATGLCCGLHQPHPVLAPDGSRVVYVDYHQAGTTEACDFRCGTLWSLDPATGTRTRLTDEAGSEIGPVFSPDGAWIAFAEFAATGYDIAIVRSDGTDRRSLTSIGDVFAPSANLDPYVYLAWDANGGGVTFMRGPSGDAERELWHVTVDGLQLQRLGTITATEFAR